MLITFGNGKILTQQGRVGEHRCLTLTRSDKAHPIGSTPPQWKKECSQDAADVLILFKNIESARVLQDELNELISIWSREQAQTVTNHDNPN